MLRVLARQIACALAAVLLQVPSSFAFNTPLSDQAVREAYFLGQRRDEFMARFLSGYTKFLPLPAAGPHIYAVTFLTPFALLVQYSSRQSDYSAQDAERDHHPDEEVVLIQVELAFTPSYGPFITKPGDSRSGSPTGYQLRSPDFWRAFKFRVFDGDEEITTDDLAGEPRYLCSKGGCTLTGATVRLQFPATAFTSDTAAIDVTPPEGDPVSVEFNLIQLR
jgi:hypothetical protein